LLVKSFAPHLGHVQSGRDGRLRGGIEL
jgi:hypothetical protein